MIALCVTGWILAGIFFAGCGYFSGRCEVYELFRIDDFEDNGKEE